MINYILVMIASFIGLIGGYFLAVLAWDEVYQYKSYLEAVELVAALNVFGILILILQAKLLLSVLFIAFFALYIIDKKTLAYTILSVPFAVSSGTTLFPYIASLIFLYGLPYGSLTVHQLGKRGKEIGIARLIKDNSGFLLVGLILGIFL